MKKNQNIRTALEAAVLRHLEASSSFCMDVEEERAALADSLSGCLLDQFAVAEGETPGFSDDCCLACDIGSAMVAAGAQRPDRAVHQRVDAVPVRRGLLADLRVIFANAKDMAGSLPRREIAAAREHVNDVGREVLKILTAVKARKT